jgi:hypothetical protein
LISIVESLATQSPQPATKEMKARNKYYTEEERRAGQRGHRREYAKKRKLGSKDIRVEIGSMITTWERQRKREGFKTQNDFIKHLLELHDKHCTFKNQHS